MNNYHVQTPEQRVLAELAALRETVRSLQGSPTRVPMYDSDPDAESPVTLWMLVDGRLRGRRPNGTIVEYANVDHNHDDRYAQLASPGGTNAPGGGVSTVPPPAAAYVPSTRVYGGSDGAPADWSVCYWRGGTDVYDNADGRLYYGMYTTRTGELKSMLHFPNLQVELAPSAAGPTRIAEVWLRLTNLHTFSNAGGTLSIGVHNTAGPPPYFQETEWPPLRIGVGKPSVNGWYQLPNWVGEAARDNRLQGLTLNQRSTSRSQYGYAASDARLKIVHVK